MSPPPDLVPYFKISFSGTILEVEEVVIERDSFDDLIAETLIEDINIEEEFDEDFPSIKFKVVELLVESSLPENLKFNGKLIVNEDEKDITLTGSDQKSLDLTDTLTKVFTNPDKLNISLIKGDGLGLSAIDNVTLSAQESYKVGMKITAGLESIYSRPEEVEVPEDLKDAPDILQEVAIDFFITNNSPADLALAILLSPSASVDPGTGKLNDPATKEFQMRVKAGSLVNPETTESTLKIAHEDFKAIFGDFKNEYFYSQILVANDSEEGKFTSDHYLEIKSRAHVKVRIDPEKMGEEE